MVGTMRKNTRALEAPVARLVQAMNLGRSASGRPSSSQITESGRIRAYRVTRSAGLPCTKSSSASWSASARMRGAISRTALRRKASSTIPRNLVWSGSSTVSMFLVNTRNMLGIHQRSPAMAPSSFRKVNSWLSFRTREAISCVVVIQIRPIIGSLLSTTGPAARNLSSPATASRKKSWLVKSMLNFTARPAKARAFLRDGILLPQVQRRLRGGCRRLSCSLSSVRVEQLAAVPHNANAEVLQVLRSQVRQDRVVYLVLAEGRLIPFEAELSQPIPEVH